VLSQIRTELYEGTGRMLGGDLICNRTVDLRVLDVPWQFFFEVGCVSIKPMGEEALCTSRQPSEFQSAGEWHLETQQVGQK